MMGNAMRTKMTIMVMIVVMMKMTVKVMIIIMKTVTTMIVMQKTLMM